MKKWIIPIILIGILPIMGKGGHRRKGRTTVLTKERNARKEGSSVTEGKEGLTSQRS